VACAAASGLPPGTADTSFFPTFQPSRFSSTRISVAESLSDLANPQPQCRPRLLPGFHSGTSRLQSAPHGAHAAHAYRAWLDEGATPPAAPGNPGGSTSSAASSSSRARRVRHSLVGGLDKSLTGREQKDLPEQIGTTSTASGAQFIIPNARREWTGNCRIFWLLVTLEKISEHSCRDLVHILSRL